MVDITIKIKKSYGGYCHKNKKTHDSPDIRYYLRIIMKQILPYKKTIAWYMPYKRQSHKRGSHKISNPMAAPYRLFLYATHNILECSFVH